MAFDKGFEALFFMACWTQLNLDEKTEIITEAVSSSFFHLIKNHDHAGIALFCGNIVIGCDSLHLLSIVKLPIPLLLIWESLRVIYE